MLIGRVKNYIKIKNLFPFRSLNQVADYHWESDF